jgi:DNA-binding LytR/AlgR family response regulator
MIKCLIVDDEPLALDILHNYITNTPGYELAAAYTKPLEAFSFLQNNAVDLLFIDIQMPELNGLQLIRSLKNPPQVILTTAFREYGTEGFEIQALDYLVKPVSRERFLKSLDKFSGLTKKELSREPSLIDEAHVFIKVDKSMVKVRLSDIFFVESLGNYVRIKTSGKDVVTYHSLSYMEDKLPTALFTRVHKSFLVNLNHIDKYTNDEIEIAGKTLPVGRTFKDALLTRLQRKLL